MQRDREPQSAAMGGTGPLGTLGHGLHKAAQLSFFYTMRIPVRLALRGWCRARLFGEERIPARGGVIVAANHASLLDPPVLQAYVPRHLTFLMTDKFDHIAPVRWYGRFWGVVVVREAGMNREAVRGALAALARGCAVGIFPEGGLSRDGLIHDPQPGIALIAGRAGVPVVPVGISGTERVLPPDTWRLGRARVAMVVGEPIDPEGLSRQDILDRINQGIRDAAAEAKARAANPPLQRPCR